MSETGSDDRTGRHQKADYRDGHPRRRRRCCLRVAARCSGDPVAMMISPGASAGDIAALRAHYGLDGSLATQFWVWLRSMLSGDLGTSISLHRNVGEVLLERLPATLELCIAALEFAALVGG